MHRRQCQHKTNCYASINQFVVAGVIRAQNLLGRGACGGFPPDAARGRVLPARPQHHGLLAAGEGGREGWRMAD